MSGNVLDCKHLLVLIKLDKNIIPFNQLQNRLEYLSFYIPKTVTAQAMVAQHFLRLAHVEYVHLFCQHLEKTLTKSLNDVSTDLGVLQWLNSSNCPCSIVLARSRWCIFTFQDWKDKLAKVYEKEGQALLWQVKSKFDGWNDAKSDWWRQRKSSNGMNRIFGIHPYCTTRLSNTIEHSGTIFLTYRNMHTKLELNILD